MPARTPLETTLMKHVEELRVMVQSLSPSDMIGEIPKHHMEYMLDCMAQMTDYGKLNRWIGFVHGVLAVHGFLNIEQLRQMMKDTNIATTNSEEKALVLGRVEDVVSDFFYYDRKEDSELTIAGLNEAIESGFVSLEEIGEEFMFQVCRQRS